MKALNTYFQKIIAQLERYAARIAPGVSPVERDWLLTLLSFLCIILLLLVLSVYFFLTATDRSASFNQNNTLNMPETIKRSELNDILKSYQTKQVEYNRIIENPTIPVDPSQ